MPLVDVLLTEKSSNIPSEVRAFLSEADCRIEKFRWENQLPAFVPSNYAQAYRALLWLESSNLLTGRWFCEWGSGFGVVACLAAMLEFDAWGIEIEGELVKAARSLADDFGLTAEFVQGSFIPSGGKKFAKSAGECSWMSDIAGGGHEKLGFEPEDFDVIFAYPWPDEEEVTAALFERYARLDAILITYHEEGGLRMRRKVSVV
jgi:hypothetical protein